MIYLTTEAIVSKSWKTAKISNSKGYTSKAVAWRWSVKKVFLKISQISQENSSVGISL